MYSLVAKTTAALKGWAVSMTTVSYVVGVDVCVIPLQSVIQNSDDHPFPCDSLLPHRDHVQVQLRQRGRRPRVLLLRHKQRYYGSMCYKTLVL